ncbi:MAG: putative ABC transporter permease [Oscillospiraceae bacterium]|nr:putative ABC transporter permease [Oscillospiraceae bacterium]
MVLDYFLWFLFYSFLGWLYESVLCSIQGGKLVNRGFLIGPVCPIYGAGAVLLIGALSQVGNPALLFFAGIGLACSLEYFTSWLLEKLFHARWWDYSRYRFNLNGRICLLGALVFGVFTVLLLLWLHPAAKAVTAQIPETYKLFFSGFLLSALFIDGAATLANLISLKQKLCEIQDAINTFMGESRAQAGTFLTSLLEKFEGSRFYSERIRLLQHMTLQEKRILNAFPTVKSRRYGEALQHVKQRLKTASRQNRRRE